MSVEVDGYSQSMSRPWKLFDRASCIDESMNVFRRPAWLAMAENVDGLEAPPPMDKRVLTEGFFF